MPHSICLFNLFFDTVSSRVVYLWLAVGRLGDIMEHPLLMDYGPIPGWLILAVIGLVSVSFFSLPSLESNQIGYGRSAGRQI